MWKAMWVEFKAKKITQNQPNVRFGIRLRLAMGCGYLTRREWDLHRCKKHEWFFSPHQANTREVCLTPPGDVNAIATPPGKQHACIQCRVLRWCLTPLIPFVQCSIHTFVTLASRWRLNSSSRLHASIHISAVQQETGWPKVLLRGNGR